MVTPTSVDLRRLLPLATTADYQPNRPFTPQDYGGLLLRLDVLYSLAVDRRAYPLRGPLLLLNLFHNPVLQLWARYQVEPGRRIDKLFDDVDWEVLTLDADSDFEQPRTGDFGEDADLPTLQRFLSELASCRPEDLSGNPSRNENKAAARLRRSAEHFLSAGAHAHGEGEVLSELTAETVLHYVIALEGLLTGEEPPGELTRKISQRAAILAGEDDAQRLEIEEAVRDAYSARSKYAHGASLRDPIDLPTLRRVVRRYLLARLVIGDPTPLGSLLKVADQALLSQEVLERHLHQPLDEFWQRVHHESRSPSTRDAAGQDTGIVAVPLERPADGQA